METWPTVWELRAALAALGWDVYVNTHADDTGHLRAVVIVRQPLGHTPPRLPEASN